MASIGRMRGRIVDEVVRLAQDPRYRYWSPGHPNPDELHSALGRFRAAISAASHGDLLNEAWARELADAHGSEWSLLVDSLLKMTPRNRMRAFRGATEAIASLADLFVADPIVGLLPSADKGQDLPIFLSQHDLVTVRNGRTQWIKPDRVIAGNSVLCSPWPTGTVGPAVPWSAQPDRAKPAPLVIVDDWKAWTSDPFWGCQPHMALTLKDPAGGTNHEKLVAQKFGKEIRTLAFIVPPEERSRIEMYCRIWWIRDEGSSCLTIRIPAAVLGSMLEDRQER